MNCQWGFLKNLKASNSLLQTQLILHLHFPLYEKNKEYSWNICFSILEFPDSRLPHRFKTSTLSSILSVNVDVPPLIYNSPLSEAQACPFLLGNELEILDTRPVNIFVNQKTIILLRCEVVFEQDFFRCQTKKIYTSKSINTLMCSVDASNLV